MSNELDESTTESCEGQGPINFNDPRVQQEVKNFQAKISGMAAGLARGPIRGNGQQNVKARNSNLNSSCEHLDGSLERLSRAVGILDEKLQPFLRAPMPATANECAAPVDEASSGVIKMMNHASTRVDAVISHVQDLIERLDD